MTTHYFTPTPARRRGRSRWSAIMAAFVAVMFAANVLAQAPAPPGGAAAAPSPEELEKLVGRIALYPDDLVAVILPAATNPLQLVQADRYLDKRKADPKLPLDENWDDAVKTLLNYPDVVKSMSADLDWTSDLGEAVVADQGAVLEAIQVFRRKTQAVGNLKSDDKQKVVVEKEVITIVPSDPQVIYVPQYNPSTVVVSGGYPSYGYYPSPYPSYYYPYPPGAALATGLIWGAAIGAAWSGGRYASHYGGGGNNNININRNTNINTGNINTGNINRGGAGGGAGSSQWKSNKQPGQVSRSTGRTPSSSRVGYGGSGAGAGAGGGRASAQPAGGGRDFGGGGGGRDAGGGARPSTQQAGGGAFGGSSASGRQTQMDSSRGASSRGSMSGGASRSASSGGFSGGGARASGFSGGGGGGRGGGGGGRGGGGRGGGGGGRR
jgi:uncharacterized protein DUF3300